MAPRSYKEPDALRHLHEAISTAIREHGVTDAVVWGIEGNARMNSAMKPRIRAEGVICAAGAQAGCSVALRGWAEIQAMSGTPDSKEASAHAHVHCGVAVGDADSHAVLAALAAVTA